MLEVANGNANVQEAFLRVLHLLDPPTSLVRPRALLPVLARRRAAPLTAPPAPTWQPPDR